MATATDDIIRKYDTQDWMNDFPVIASDLLYEGSAIGDNGSGYARPLEAGDPFRGFADERADNSAGSAGDIDVRCRVKGRVQLAITSLAIDDVGKPVYASDDTTFTLTAGANTQIGVVSRFVSTGYGIVEFDVSGNKPAYEVAFAGEQAWSGSGASLAASVTGVLATDIVVASIQTVPSQAAYLVSAAATADTLTFVLSAANTSDDAVISYAVYRAVL